VFAIVHVKLASQVCVDVTFLVVIFCFNLFSRSVQSAIPVPEVSGEMLILHPIRQTINMLCVHALGQE